ncbi:response regulator [Paenarthrobacter sp. RAF54_2]|uniref:response regulator n=1 Tax=Paenarthrobacter sp. RAF54_2 TaxID=3233061 RepID=UPI003F94FF2C
MDPRRAVVIEDDPDLSLLISTILTGIGYTVSIAATGQAGVQAVREQEPTLITTGLGLPSLRGLEAIRAIREFSIAPILVISASNDPREVEQALVAGGDTFLPKPFSTRPCGPTSRRWSAATARSINSRNDPFPGTVPSAR